VFQLINYLPIKLDGNISSEIIEQYRNIFNIYYHMAQTNLSSCIEMIQSIIRMNDGRLTMATIEPVIKSYVGELISYKEWKDPFVIKVSFNDEYIYLFLIDKPIQLNNNI
jgi:hypothetical protein